MKHNHTKSVEPRGIKIHHYYEPLLIPMQRFDDTRPTGKGIPKKDFSLKLHLLANVLGFATYLVYTFEVKIDNEWFPVTSEKTFLKGTRWYGGTVFTHKEALEMHPVSYSPYIARYKGKKLVRPPGKSIMWIIPTGVGTQPRVHWEPFKEGDTHHPMERK